MVVHDIEGSGRSELTKRTLASLADTVDWKKHRMAIVNNGSTDEFTKFIFDSLFIMPLDPSNCTRITNPTNNGTAKAVNQGLKLRQPGEYCIKMDNDIVVHQPYWIEEMQEVMERMPELGILGLKRKDLGESTYSINTDQRSKLIEVPHEPGQRWYVIEEAKHIMGSCTMLSPALLDKIGYFYQCDGLYGFDDSLMCVRAQVAGFRTAFLPHIHIDHIDPGGTEYTEWKRQEAGKMLERYAAEERLYKQGVKDVYYGGE